MNLPDYLFGVGGAGREVVRTFMEQDWIVEEAIQDGQDVHAYFVDTDTDVDPDDDEGPVGDTEQRVKEELEMENASTSINATHVNLVEDLRVRPDNDQLLHENTVQEIADTEQLEAWWLERDWDLLRRESNYTEGVRRRRGLTKAIYHYGRNDDHDPIGGIYRTVNGGTRGAVVVGLGGGSGAGVFIDMAKNLSDDVSLTLFAVLPDPTAVSEDEAPEFANAFAALSELERLALTEQNPFENIVLVPKGPATNDPNFDRALVYTITGFYNVEGDAINTIENYSEAGNDGLYKFAPFTFALPQIVTYPGGTREETRSNLATFVENREMIQNAEEQLLTEAEAFIDTHYDEYTDGLFDETGTVDESLDPELYGESTGLYQARIEPLRDLLEAEFMEQQNFDSVDALLGDWDDIVRENTDDGPVSSAAEREAIIDDLADLTFGGDTRGTESELMAFVYDELEAVGRRAALRRTAKGLPHATVTGELEYALGYDTGTAASEASDLADWVSNLETTTENERSAVEAVTDDAEAERDERIEEWRESHETVIESFVTLHRYDSKIEELLTTLDRQLDGFAENAKRWGDETEAREAIDGFDFDRSDLGNLDDALSTVGIDAFDPDVITGSIEGLQEAGAAKLRDKGLRGKLRSIIGGDPDRDEYQEKRNHEIDERVFDVGKYNGSFDPDATGAYVSEIREQFRKRKETVREELVGSLSAATTTASAEYDGERDRSALVERTEAILERYDEAVTEWTEDVRDEFGVDDAFANLGIDERKRPTTVRSDTDRPDVSDDIEAAVENVASAAANEDPDTVTSYDAGAAESDLESALEDALTTVLVAPIDDVESAFDDFGGELSEAKSKFEELDGVVEKGKAFSEQWADDEDWRGPIRPDTIPERPEEFGSGTDGHIATLIPDEPGRLDATDLADSGIWGADNERRKLTNAMKESFERAFERGRGDHLPIETWDISTSNQTFEHNNYRVQRARMTHFSRAFEGHIDTDPKTEQNANIQRITDTVPGSPANGFGHTKCTFADDWDFASVLFVGGIPLDNITLLQDHYRSGYRTIAGKDIEISDPTDRFDGPKYIDSSVIKHAYGIDGTTDDVPEGDDGVYYTREQFIDFDDDDSLATLLDHDYTNGDGERRVCDELLEDYYHLEGFVSTRPVTDEREE